MVAVYVVVAVRLLDGRNDAVRVWSSYETVPLTGVVPGPVSLKFAATIVSGSICWSKVASIWNGMHTFVTPPVGLVAITCGAVD